MPPITELEQPDCESCEFIKTTWGLPPSSPRATPDTANRQGCESQPCHLALKDRKDGRTGHTTPSPAPRYQLERCLQAPSELLDPRPQVSGVGGEEADTCAHDAVCVLTCYTLGIQTFLPTHRNGSACLISSFTCVFSDRVTLSVLGKR